MKFVLILGCGEKRIVEKKELSKAMDIKIICITKGMV